MQDGSELATATAVAVANAVAAVPAALPEAGAVADPDAADPGAHATATAPIETTLISARTSRRDRTRPIKRSSSSGSDIGETGSVIDQAPVAGSMAPQPATLPAE